MRTAVWRLSLELEICLRDTVAGRDLTYDADSEQRSGAKELGLYHTGQTSLACGWAGWGCSCVLLSATVPPAS